jgi:hypothetical protein
MINEATPSTVNGVKALIVLQVTPKGYKVIISHVFAVYPGIFYSLIYGDNS